MYQLLKTLKADYDRNPQESHPFYELLTMTDVAVATYMALADDGRWFTDRNSFLKREELIRGDRIIQATTATKLKSNALAKQIKLIVFAN